MSTTVNTGWLKDNNGEKFAPKTLASQVVNAEGISIENKLNEMLATKADTEHSHEILDIENLQSTLDSKVNQTDLDALSETVNSKANTSALTSHTEDTIIHVTQIEKDTWDSKANDNHSHTVTDITGLTATVSELNKLDGVTSTTAEINYLAGVESNIQTQLDEKQATISGGASTITSSNLTTNRALISNGSGKVAVSAVTSTELGYLDGVTSNIQDQLDNLTSVKIVRW